MLLGLCCGPALSEELCRESLPSWFTAAVNVTLVGACFPAAERLFRKFATEGISPRVVEMRQSFNSGETTARHTLVVSRLDVAKPRKSQIDNQIIVHSLEKVRESHECFGDPKGP